MGKKFKFVPRALISGLERLIHQDELNEILRVTYPKQGTEFAEGVYEYLNLKLEVIGLDKLPEGRYVFASNHPLGGLDGIGLIKILGAKYGDENLRVLVNDMLMNVIPLSNVFLAINKYGSQGRQASEAINDAYMSDKQIVVFPAGLVSRLGDDGTVADLTWQKSFIVKARQSEREIVPVFFDGNNSARFYKTARLRKKLKIGVNIEQALLPGEVFKARNKTFRVIFGDPIPLSAIAPDKGTPQQLARMVRQKADLLKKIR